MNLEVGKEIEDGCPECGHPAVVKDRQETVHGVDYDGSDSIFAIVRIYCAAGHAFMAIDSDRTVHAP